MTHDPPSMPERYVDSEGFFQCPFCGVRFEHGDSMIPNKQPVVLGGLGVLINRPPRAVNDEGKKTGMFGLHPECYRKYETERRQAENDSLDEHDIDLPADHEWDPPEGAQW